MAQITVDPGGSSGWHSHPGGAIIVVNTGTLNIYRSVGGQCQTETYSAGQAFIERPGELDNVLNMSSSPYVLYVTFPRVPQGVSPRTGFGSSLHGALQQRLELACGPARGEEGVGIVALGEPNQANGESSLAKSSREVLRGLLAATVAVGIEGEIDRPRGIAKLAQLTSVQMCAQRAGNVAESSLPQGGVVEEPLYQDDGRFRLHLRPAVEAAFGSGQKPVRGCRCRKATAIKIAFQRKDDTVDIRIVAGWGDQASLAQHRKGIA